MQSQSRFGATAPKSTETSDPFPRLVELLLGVLVSDVPGARGALLSTSGADTCVIGDPKGADQQVSVGASTPDGDRVTITVGIDRPSAGDPRAVLRRFAAPMVACIGLERQLRRHQDDADVAVADVERTAVLDIATGIVMARRNCDVATARDLVNGWAAQDGTDLTSAPAAELLARLAAGVERDGRQERR